MAQLKLMAAAKPNSIFGGVQIGTITYSFRSLPSSAEETLKYCVECGISGIELMSNVAESYAGSPQQGRGGGRADARCAGRPAAGAGAPAGRLRRAAARGRSAAGRRGAGGPGPRPRGADARAAGSAAEARRGD